MKELLANHEVAMLIELRQLLDDGRFVDVLDHIGPIEADEHLSLSNALRAQLLSLKGSTLSKLNRYDEALEAARTGLDLIKHSSDNQLIAALQATAARALTERGHIGEAERVYRDLIATYRRLDDTTGVIQSLSRLARVHFIKGQFGKAADCLLEAEDYARALGDTGWLARISGNAGTVLMLSGEFARAIEHLEESLDLNATTGDLSNLCKAHLSLAFSLMHLGRFTDAAGHLTAADELVAKTESIADHINLVQYQAQLALLQKQFAEAAQVASQALQLALDANPHGAEVAQIGRILAEAEFGLGHLTAAENAASQALTAAQATSERVETAACRRLLALIAHEQTGAVTAETTLRQVCDECDAIGARYETAVSYQALAQVATEPALVREARSEAERILRTLGITRSDASLRSKTPTRSLSPALIGADPVFTSVLRDIERVAESDLAVLLLGPTGAGKDMVARLVHEKSSRCKGPFIQVNCGAIPLELAESEFFGHERGSFTNAVDTKLGLMEAAHGGTLFLNEVGELSERIQVKLLSAIEEKSILRVGGTVPRKADFRIVAATNVDLIEAVRQGRFRSDLYFRLAVMTKQLPRLADRGDDAYLLFRHFLESADIALDSVDRRTLDLVKARLASYDWPGNVRELRNWVDGFCVSEKRDARAICLRMIDRLSRHPLDVKKPALAESICLTEQVEEYERSVISTALDICGGIIRRAAAHLGIPEGTLRSKMKKYRISAA